MVDVLRSYASVILVFLFVKLQINSCYSKTLFWKVTYRDFLPAGCMRNKVDLLGNISPVSAAVRDELAFAWENLNTQALSFQHERQCPRMDQNWQDALEAGLISGHPDFNAQGYFTTYDTGCNQPFPVGTCIGQPGKPYIVTIINTTLEINQAGIPKPQYCLSGEDSRCGQMRGTSFGQTRKKYFDTWFNDDNKYNKRVGQRLRLFEQVDGNYQYNSNDANNTKGNENFDFHEDKNPNFFGAFDRFKDENDDNVVVVTDFPNPYDAPAWPQFNRDQINAGLETRTWSATTEVHETFEYRSDQRMEFSFAGDDDFWAFINGKMAIDLGGLHGAIQKTIDLNGVLGGVPVAELLNLTDGGIYTLDIFHAERNYIDSNFRVTTSLFPSCNVLQSGTVAIDSSAVASQGSINSEYFKTSSVEVDGLTGSIRISKPSELFSANFLYSQQKQNIGRGFVSTFNVKVDGNTDGFAFVAQNWGLENYPLSGTPNFNFKDIPASFAIVFDLCKSVQTLCDTQEVRVHYPDSVETGNNAQLVTRKTFDEINRNLKRNQTFEVEIIYYGGRPNFLEVYIDKSLFLRENDFQIQNILGALGAHVGFTSTTSSVAANIDITDWTLTTVEVDPTRTTYVPLVNASNTVVSDGVSKSGGLIVKTFDGCDNPLDTGTLGNLIDAIYVEKLNTNNTYSNGSLVPTVVEAVVVDNDDGSYSLQLVTTVEAEYEFWITFGEGCSLDFQIPDESSLSTPYVFTATVNQQGTLGCFFFNEPDGAESLPFFPPTASPTEQFIPSPAPSLNIPAIAAGSGTAIFVGISIGIMMLYYRRKWQQKKGYIEGGKRYILDANTQFDEDTPYTVTASQVIATQAEINRKRAQAKENPQTAAIAKLQEQIEERKEEIKQTRRRIREETAPKKKRVAAINQKHRTEF